MSQQVKSPPKDTQEIREGPEESKVKVEEGKEERPLILPASSEEKKENDTQKIDIQSPIQAMIEKPESAGSETSSEQKAVERKPKRTKSSKKAARSELESAESDIQSASIEKIKQQNKQDEQDKKDSGSDVPTQLKPIEELKILTRGVAHFKENVIKIAGGFKLHSGDEIRIGDRVFELRHLEPSKKPLYWGILALGIVILFFIFQFGFTGYKDTGKIVGVVIDRSSGVFLPNAEVQLLDLGKKVQSNDLGFFVLDVIPAGTYELQAQANGFNPVRENAVVLKKQITTTIVQLSSGEELASTNQPGYEGRTAKSGSESGTSGQSAISKPQPGSIKIESNVPEVQVYVDGRYLGTGNEVYSGISDGTHAVRLSKENYQDWTGRVTVKGNKVSGLKANLDRMEASRNATAPSREESYFTLAQNEYNSGNYAGAVENYSKWLNQHSDNAESYLGRGNSYLKLGDKTRATADLSNGAKLFETEGNFNKAVLCYTQILSLTPGDQNTLYNRALDYIKIGEYEKAVPDLKKVTDKNPKFFNGFMQLGSAQYYSEDYQGAVETYARARKLNPNDKQVYVRLAITYVALKDKSEAKRNYEKFKELTTLVDREKMKDSSEWVEVLKFLGENTEKEF